MSNATAAARRRRKLALFASALAGPSLILGLGAAHAQSTDTTGQGVEQIVVTAEKRSENIQDVPLAVTAIGNGEILKSGLDGNEALARIVPSLTFTELSPGQNSLSIRGLTNAYGLAPTVSYYVDETVLDGRQDAKAGTPSVDMFDAARVEVLRGPQGTLYGASSLGGTIRVLMNQPDPTHFSMHAEGGLDTVDNGGAGYEAKGTFNVPLGDKLALRVTATEERYGGFTTEILPASYYTVSPADQVLKTDANPTNITSIRAAAAWMPGGGWTVTPSFYYQHVKAYGYNYSDQNRPDYQYVRGFQDVNTDDLYIANVIVKKDFGFSELTSSSSYSYSDQDSFEDYSAWAARHYAAIVKSTVGVPFFPTTNYEPIPYYEYTQEVRLSSTGEGWVSWTLGGYYSSLKEKERQAITSASYGAWYTAHFGLPNTSNILDYHGPTLDVQYAGFADLTLRPIPMVEVTAGVRAYELDQTSHIAENGLNAGGNVPVTNGSEDGYNPRFNIDFKPNDDLSFYATASKGFRPGGPNTQLVGGQGVTCTLLNLFNNSYQPDSVWNYEGGAKTAFFDKKLTFDSAIYQIDWSNIQGSLSSNCGTFIANFGSERIKGAETEVHFRVLPGLTLNGSASYNDARYNSLKPGVGSALGIHVGQRAVNVPRIKYTFGGEYDFRVAQSRDAYLRADLEHMGSTPSSLTFSTPSYYRPAYTNVNASIGAYFGPTEVQLYVKNLTNEYEVVNIVNSQIQTYQENVVSPPRTFGVSVRYALR